MADTAYQIQYREEYIAGFEVGQSWLRQLVTTDADIQAQQAVFLVADSGGAAAVTRGVNGLIPARADNLNQFTATLQEWHDLPRRTRFNIFASQGDGRRIMQETSVKVMNRKIDLDIISALQTGTNYLGATAAAASLQTVMYGQTVLLNNGVENDGEISWAISPAFHAYLMQTKEFGSVQYVTRKPFEEKGKKGPIVFDWAGMMFVVHPNLPGIGTNAETCFCFHKAAIGHACDIDQVTVAAGYNEEQDYSWARTSQFMGSKLLQNKGVVLVRHDGSAFAPTA